MEQAQTEMRSVSVAIAGEYPSVSGWSTDVVPFQREAVGDMRTPLLMLFGAVGLLLLIALGKELILNDRPHTIVGVMPARFSFPDAAEVWS